jgi:hypothetical protein
MKLSQRGAERLRRLRSSLDEDPTGRQRQLITAVDGSFTNATVLRKLPERTTLIGRLRKDAKLYALPVPHAGKRPGRKPNYGERLPTPEQLRQDTSVPWHTVQAWSCGKIHSFQLKTIAPVRWRAAGPEQNLRLVVIRPLAYRLSAHSRTLYRKPAYLICTDPDMPLEQLLQTYLWRWGIEVNFRDEKTLLGAGEAQVRNAGSVQSVPALLVASYALLMLAAHHTFDKADHKNTRLPQPKWRKQKPQRPITTAQAISHLRAQLWGKAMGVEHFSHFTTTHPKTTKPPNYQLDLSSAVIYASR